MEAVFMFQWGSLFFRWVASLLSREDTPWGALVLMGGFQKSGWGGGMPPPPLWETLPQVTQFLEGPT